MAMHKKLDIGSVLFTFHEPTYFRHKHVRGENKYKIHFKALYIYNRRERTSGDVVPNIIIPTLDKLKIKYLDAFDDKVVAVGCRSYSYYTCTSKLPYPSVDDIKKAKEALDELLTTERTIGDGINLMETTFMSDFIEKKVSNKDVLFSLNKPIDQYLEKEYLLN